MALVGERLLPAGELAEILNPEGHKTLFEL